MDDLLLGYVLDALGPAEAAAVEARLRDDPAAADTVARLRRLIQPLAADRSGYDPPPGLATDTVARVAAHVVAGRQADREPPTWPRTAADGPVFPVRRPIEVLVAAAIALLAVGLVLGGVQKFREASQLAACQNNLRVMYQGLTDYADTHDGDYPRVGGPNAPTAGAFVSVLVEARQYPDNLKLVCAADPDPAAVAVAFRPDPLFPPGPDVLNQIGYVYTLGYRAPGGVLVGLRRADGLTDDRTPLAADLPARAVSPAAGPVSPHGRGQNVLFADGRVQFFTAATVGPNGDDIYRNDAGWVKAGLHRLDASLGRATDAP